MKKTASILTALLLCFLLTAPAAALDARDPAAPEVAAPSAVLMERETGTVLYAAEGKLRPEDIPAILDSGNRTLAGPTAPPGGLYLTRVWYEDERLNGKMGV